MSDSCSNALLQQGNTDPKIQRLNLDLNVPREPIWVAAQVSTHEKILVAAEA